LGQSLKQSLKASLKPSLKPRLRPRQRPRARAQKNLHLPERAGGLFLNILFSKIYYNFK
jgi:hypothetical protein